MPSQGMIEGTLLGQSDTTATGVSSVRAPIKSLDSAPLNMYNFALSRVLFDDDGLIILDMRIKI